MLAWRRREVAVLICLALGLSACGGGGGNSSVKSTSSSTPTPSPTPSSPSPSSNVPTPPIDAQLTLTNTYAAHQQGYTGVGVTIGVVDSGIMPNNPAVAGRVGTEYIDVDPTTNNTSIPDVVGHGTWVSEIAAGVSFGQFAGGIAPAANLVSARIIDDNAPDDNGSTAPSQVTTSDATFMQQVNQQMISSGVQVENNSWGGITWDTTNTSLNQAFASAYLPFILNGGLVVFAAGNDSQANPSTIASLPTVANNGTLQNGWLVAVALNSNNPTQLDSYSNKCGIAMNYCLAAPGDVIVLDKDTLASTTNPTYYIVEGTSFAAPEVSGAAALVWQAYPYFSSFLVQQTLLGTATPLGGAQPNPTFGYGALNVGAAVNGPEQFNWGTVEVGFKGTSFWNNPISGSGGLTFDGPGTLNLTQPSTYTGDTVVNGGTLNVVSIASSLTNVAAGGALAFTGAPPASTPSMAGNVWNQGVLAVSPTSNLTISGNYVQGNETQFGAYVDPGELAISLGSSLQVSGTAVLPQGSKLYVYGANNGYVANAHTEVLYAAGGLTGTFASLSWPSSVVLQATLGYSSNDAYLNVSSISLTQVPGVSYAGATYASAERAQGAFNTINSAIQNSGNAQPLPSSFVGGAASIQQSQTTAALQQSLNSLSGQMYAASAAMTFEAIDADTRALSDRFDALLDHPQLLSLNKFQSWSQNLGYQGSMARSGFDSLGFQLNGTMIGGDRAFGNGGVVGYAISQSQGLGNIEQSADQGFSRALEGMVYGGFVQGNWYTMGRFGVGSDWQDTRRELILGGQTAGVSSFSNGSYDVMYGESGYRFNLGDWKFTPFANLEYASVDRDGFNEQGGDGFGLMSPTQSIQRWQGGFGLRSSRQWIMANGTSLSLQARLLWQDAFAMHGVSPNASFTALQQFTPIEGIGLSRYGSVAGLSLDWRFSARSNLSFGVDEYNAQHEHATMGTLNYSLHF
ncbi:autotransporter domain-containing protein [Dyella caseinilytica]|uniref:Autotransporter domain-containing protein n=2 Tax=Dyella caseinilytica TaxID=1849581 RepID=A0ABX7GZ87_9GAMM|nr:autotransporter domain-containing protein [Dyella caseinilytica]